MRTQATESRAAGAPRGASGTDVVALRIEKSLTPWVTVTADTPILMMEQGKRPEEKPARELGRSDWCLQPIREGGCIPTTLTQHDLEEMGFGDVPCMRGNGVLEVDMRLAAFFGMVLPSHTANCSKKKLDEDKVLTVRCLAAEMGVPLDRQYEEVAAPAVSALGFEAIKASIVSHNKALVQPLPACPSACYDAFVKACRGTSGIQLFDRLMDMPSPIPEALLYGVIASAGRVQKAQKGKVSLLFSGIRKEYVRQVFQLLMMLGAVPSQPKGKTTSFYVYSHGLGAAIAVDRLDSLAESVMHAASALTAERGNKRTQFAAYGGKRYAAHRVAEVRLGTVEKVTQAQGEARQDALFEIALGNRGKGQILCNVALDALTVSTIDHRDRKTKEREQHMNGTFVPKRTIDAPSKTYIRKLPTAPTGRPVPKRIMPLFDGQCQLLTARGCVLARKLQVGDSVLGGDGKPHVVTAVRKVAVDEDFADILVHHIGHAHLSQGSLIRVLPGVQRGYSAEDLVPTGRNSHLTVTYPSRIADAIWKPAVSLDNTDWIPLPNGNAAYVPETLPVFDLASFIEPQELQEHIGKIRYEVDDENITWWNYKSFKGKEYANIRIGDVAKSTGIPRGILHDISWGGEANSVVMRLLRTHLDGIGMSLQEWCDTVRSPVDVVIPRYVEVTEELAYLLGFYLADGSAVNGGILFALDLSKPEEEASIEAAMEKCFPSLVPGRRQLLKPNDSKSKGYVINYSCPLLARLFKSIIPQTLRDKRIPDWMFGMPDDCSWSLLHGLVDGDGSLKNSRLNYTSASAELVWQVRSLLMRFGVPCRCNEVTIRASNGTVCQETILDAPITQALVDEFDVTFGKRRTTLADEDDGNIVANFRSTQLYHLCGDAFELELGGFADSVEASVVTAAGVIKLRSQ